MNKQFVTYEIAVKLKDLGFSELCLAIYNREHSLRINSINNPHDRYKSFKITANNGKIPAPLWQQVIDWFYKEHKFLLYYGTNDWSLVTPKESFLYNELLNSTVYQKWKQAILKAIELIENGKKDN